MEKEKIQDHLFMYQYIDLLVFFFFNYKVIYTKINLDQLCHLTPKMIENDGNYVHEFRRKMDINNL